MNKLDEDDSAPIVVRRTRDDPDFEKTQAASLFQKTRYNPTIIQETEAVNVSRRRRITKQVIDPQNEVYVSETRAHKRPLHQCGEMIVRRPRYESLVKTDNPDAKNVFRSIDNGRFARLEDIPDSPPLPIIDVSSRAVELIPIYRRPTSDELQKVQTVFRHKTDGVEQILNVPIIE